MGNQPKTSSKFDTSPYIAVLDTARKLGTVDQNALEALERFKRRIPKLKRKLGEIASKDAFFADAHGDLRADIRLGAALVDVKIAALSALADAFGASPMGSDDSAIKQLREAAKSLEDGLAGSRDALSEISIREGIDKGARIAGQAVSDAATAAKDFGKTAVREGAKLAEQGLQEGRKLAKRGIAAVKEALNSKK